MHPDCKCRTCAEERTIAALGAQKHDVQNAIICFRGDSKEEMIKSGMYDDYLLAHGWKKTLCERYLVKEAA